MRNSLNGFYDNISHNVTNLMKEWNVGQGTGIDFITFNYTSVLDQLVKLTYEGVPLRSPNVIHIHGTFEDAVLGMDNEEQLKTSYELSNSFKRHFLKPYFNEEYDRQRVLDSINLIEEADVICVFGLSLGVSDLTWRMALLNWLSKNVHHHLIIYDYEMSRKKLDLVADKMDEEDEAIDRMFNAWNVELTPELKRQVHMPCGKNIFNVGEIIAGFTSEKRK